MRRVLFLFTALASACSGSAGPLPPAAVASAPGGAAGVERFFPLVEGKIYHYVTKDGPDTGMLVAKAHRVDATRGELRLSNATKRFVYTSDGVAYDGGAYILKEPLAAASAWPGEHGGTTTIAKTDLAITVPAGSYSGCIQTVEEGGRPPGSRYESTYCPGVGMVRLVVTAGGSEARAELSSYGDPVKIE